MVFVKNIQMEEALSAIAGVKEFRVKKCDKMGYTILNYDFAHGKTFPNPAEKGISEKESRRRGILRECRGLMFDSKSGEIIARRYHKFFNIGEKKETQPEVIDLTNGFHILDKLDGQLASPFLIRGEVRWGTKMGFNTQSDIEKMFVQFNSHYNDFSKKWLEEGMTPLFEWCSPSAPIVIRHTKDRLILTAIRCNKTGSYMPFEQMEKAANEHTVDCVTPLIRGSDLNIQTADELVKHVDPMKDTEGCVVVLGNGLMYKIKTSWYRSLASRSKASGFQYMQEADVWKSILDGTIDDNISQIPTDKLEKIRKYTSMLWEALSDFVDQHLDSVNEFIKILNTTDRRTAASVVGKKYPKNRRKPSVNAINAMMGKFLLGLKNTQIPDTSFTHERLRALLVPVFIKVMYSLGNKAKHVPLDIPKWIDFMHAPL